MDISNYNIEQCDAVSVLNAIMDMHDHPQKIDQIAAAISPIAAAAAAYSEGKPQLAQAITAKGVTTAADASLATMAANIHSIQQETITIDGGEMYAAQLTGDGTLWDLYQVLNDMKNTFLQQAYGNNDFVYKCLIVAEYYKGSDSMQLRFADGYYTSDGVYYNEAQHLHPWNDANDGKANRWVCFLYKSEAPSITFDSNSTDISPCSIYIGGHIGNITYSANGRLTEIVCGVQETDVIDEFIGGGYTQEWNNDCILRNVKSVYKSSSNYFYFNGGKGNLIIENLDDMIGTIYATIIQVNAARNVIVKGIKKITGNGRFITPYSDANLVEISVPDIEEIGVNYYFIEYTQQGSSFKKLNLPSLKKNTCPNLLYLYGASCPNFIDFVVGPMETNLKIAAWNPTNVLADSTLKATLISNIVNHILARVSDHSETTFLNFTVSTNMCNAIKDELVEWPIGSGTQMTLYNAFQTKGWNLLGA